MTLLQTSLRRRRVKLIRSLVVLFAPGAKSLGTLRSRTARRAVFWGVAVLLLAHVLMAVAVETVVPQARDPEYAYRQFGALDLQKTHPDRPLVLVLGTSRTQNAIDPSSMGFADEPGSPVVFNAGLSGALPPYLWLNYHRLHAAGVRPAAILVELFPATLPNFDAQDVFLLENAPRLTFADVRRMESFAADPAAIRNRWASNRANSLHSLRPVVLSHFARNWQPPQLLDCHRLILDRFGFTPLPFDTVTADYREQKRGVMENRYAPHVRLLRVSEQTDCAYRRLVSDCRDAGIPVAFFLTPESPTFCSWYSPEARATLAAFCRMLTDELGCPVFAAPEGFAEEDFADGHHVFPPAARRYSRWLADTHLKSWLASVRRGAP